MRRYQQHTHASWHRAYEGKAECPWCHEGPYQAEPTRPQSSAHYKRPTKRPDTANTHRTDVISPSPARPAEHRLKHQSFEQPASTEHKTSGTPFEPHSDPTPETADDDVEPSMGDDADNYEGYMGRTDRHNAQQSAFRPPSRPRLPEAWTQEQDIEERELGSRESNKLSGDNWRPELDTHGDFQGLSDEKAGSLELDVRELEES